MAAKNEARLRNVAFVERIRNLTDDEVADLERSGLPDHLLRRVRAEVERRAARP